jgi:hypothetical protein
MNKEFCGVYSLKQKQTTTLNDFERWATKKDWVSFGPKNHFDWWQFPVSARSGHGLKYSIYEYDLAILKEDEEFMKQLRRSVQLISLAWGWDIEKADFVSDPDKAQTWSRYDIRLRKIGQCMLMFGESRYHGSINKFVNAMKGRGTVFDDRQEWRYGELSIWPFKDLE